MPSDQVSIALQRRKLNESKVKLSKSSQTSVTQETTTPLKSYNDEIIQSISKLKVESEGISLAIPLARKLQTSHLTTTKYSGLKSASKRKRADDHPSSSSSAQKQKYNSVVNDKSQPNLISHIIKTRTTKHPVEWYNTKMTKEPYSRSELHCFQYIKTLILKRGTIRNPEELQDLNSTLRTWLHRAECYDFVSKTIIQKSKLLDEGGLTVVINSAPNMFPLDIQADCGMLYYKWLTGNLDPHLLRGLEIKKTVKDGKSCTSQSFEKNYRWRVSCDYVGAGNLVNGQWWPLQMCAMRDGAHGEIQGGIHGQLGQGAFSVVISGGTYEDIDNGNDVEYCGTAGANGVPSLATKLMRESHRLKNPVRLLRSSKSLKSAMYRPSEGIRYDGLYAIVAATILDSEKAMYRFSLRRCDGQDPIRYQGVEARPTREQLDELEKIHNLRALQA